MHTNKSFDYYATGYGVLNDFSNEFYRGTMRICRPLTSGENIIRHTQAGVILKPIDKIMNLPYQEQNELLDFLTELVIERKVKDEDWDAFKNILIEEIMNKRKFKAYFSSLDKYFKTLNNTEKFQVLSLTINKLSCDIESVRREINKRLWNEKANVQELMIIDQELYLIQNILNSLEIRKKIKKKDKEIINVRMGLSLYLLLRLEAYKRKKITVDDLTDDLYLSKMFSPNERYIKPSEFDIAFEVFGG
jgi:hypothetical protein